MQTITLSIRENHLAKLINFLVSLPKNDVKVLENSSHAVSLFDSWQDDKNADDIIQDVKDCPNDLVLQKDFDEYGALDYLAVSDDKTDENWFNSIIEMADKVSKSIATDLPLNERGWTRDELYGR